MISGYAIGYSTRTYKERMEKWKREWKRELSMSNVNELPLLKTFEENHLLKISMPLFLVLAKKSDGKKYHLNINNLHNWHFSVRNNLKKRYCSILKNQIGEVSLKKTKNISLVFVMHRKDKRKIDRANVLAIHEKFACDAIVESGLMEDDNDKHINSTHYFSGEIDKENPRVDIYLVRLQ